MAEDSIYDFPEDDSSIFQPTRNPPRAVGRRGRLRSGMISQSRQRALSSSRPSSMLHSSRIDKDDSWWDDPSQQVLDIDQMREKYSHYRHIPCQKCLWAMTKNRGKPCSNDPDGKRSCEACIKNSTSCTNPETFNKQLCNIAIMMQEAFREKLEDNMDLPDEWQDWVEYVQKMIQPQATTAKKKLDEVIKSTSKTNSAIQGRLDKLESQLEIVQERLEALEVSSGEDPRSAARSIKERLSAVEESHQSVTTNLQTMSLWFKRLTQTHMGLSLGEPDTFKPADYLRSDGRAFENVKSQLRALWGRVGGQPENYASVSSPHDHDDQEMDDASNLQKEYDMRSPDHSDPEDEE